MKKIFSKRKCMECAGIKDEKNVCSWINECDGLTEEEMKEFGYKTEERWMIEVPEEKGGNMNKSDINLKVNVDSEELEDTVDMLKEVTDMLPNITIRNNEQVYVTINNFNVPAKEYYKEVE